jgi:hypothetical protein
MDLSDELAFVSRPAEVHRNAAVDLRFLRDGSLVVVGSTSSARLTGARDELEGLVEVWSTLHGGTSRSVSDRLGMSEPDADHALGILWQAGALAATAQGATPAERFWLARDPAGDGRRPVCRVVTNDAVVRDVATDCLERSGFTVGADNADVALWLGGELDEPDGGPVLLASAHESSARIGPVFDDSPMSPCFRCFRALAKDLGASPRAASRRSWQVTVALAVQRLTSLVLHYQAGHVKNTVTEVSLAQGTRSVHATVDPDCRQCLERLGCAGTGADDEVVRYELGTYELGTEAGVAMPVGEPMPRYRPALGYRQEALDSAPAGTALHRARLVARAATGANPSEPHRRLTPSGGDLRSCDAFYILPAGGTGGSVTVGLCPPDAAAEVHEREVACPEPGIKGLLDGADAALVLVADLRRNARKYGSFGIKLALLETGCALANAAARAAALGWHVEAREGVHSSVELRGLLGLTSPHEFITCVARMRTDRGRREVET